MNNGIVIAINESGSKFCKDQVLKLSDSLDYNFYIEETKETSEKISELFESAIEKGFKHIVYLTEESLVTDVELGLKEDFGHLVESITVYPENFYRVNIERLREAPAPQTPSNQVPKPGQNAAQQKPLMPKQAPQKTTTQQPQKPVNQPETPGQVANSFLFIVPTNIPLIGTKAIVQKAVASAKGNLDYMVPVPSAGTSISPKTQLTNGTVARAIWSLHQDRSGCKRIDDETLASSTWYSCVVNKNQNFNGAFYYKLLNYQKAKNKVYTIISSKEVCLAAQSYGFKTIPICENIPNEGNNQKIFKDTIDIFDKYTKLFKDSESLNKYASEKKLDQCPEKWEAAADDQAILTILEEIYAISKGKKDPTKSNYGSDTGLSGKGLSDFMKALGELIPERDKELAKEWVKDTIVGEYIMDAGKAVKKAYDHMKPTAGQPKDDKTYTHKQKQDDQAKKIQWSNVQIQYLLVNSDDFQKIKNYFDKGFYLVKE